MNTQPSSVHAARLIFAKNMRILRRLRDISQESLAFEAGVSRTYICDIERGKRSVSIDVMGKIADALQVPLADLLHSDLPLQDYL